MRRFRFKKRNARRIGESRVRDPCKIRAIAVGSVLSQRFSRTLYADEITAIAQGDQGDQRERSYAQIKGVRIRAFIRNVYQGTDSASPAGAIPIYCNVALVGTRTLTGAADGEDINADFFRDMNNVSTQPYIAFGNTNLNGIQRHTFPINNQKFVVLWHFRFKLGAIVTSSGFSSGEFKNYRTISRYIKIGRTVRYNNSATNSCVNRIFLCQWYDGVDENPGGTLSGVAITNSSWDVHTYFRG